MAGGHDHGDHGHGGHGHAGHGHDHTHKHGHGHAHGHAAIPEDGRGRAFLIGIGLNLAFVAIEIGFGIFADSVALLADAGHNLSDVLGLVVAWGAWLLARRPASERFTYGLRGSSILAALFNGLFLMVACGGIAWEAVRRFSGPPEVAGGIVMAVAGAGIVVNLVTALTFARGAQSDLNVRGAFLHMAADAAVSAGVVLAGFATLATGQRWIDPATSLAIVAIIVASGWGLLREAIALAMAGVPEGIDTAEVRAMLGELPGVERVHHLHIWPLSTSEAALTAHLVMPGGGDDRFLGDATEMLRHRARITHATLQIERGRIEPGDSERSVCADAC